MLGCGRGLFVALPDPVRGTEAKGYRQDKPGAQEPRRDGGQGLDKLGRKIELVEGYNSQEGR